MKNGETAKRLIRNIKMGEYNLKLTKNICRPDCLRVTFFIWLSLIGVVIVVKL